ncbi:MAG: hypothetical protein HS105_09560 [Chloracidobacterium sp.]|nr:hypothetical protein [Chloracidobacterium sp.]MCO5333289.1 hypothetical protein [Pyrinomonadaceae bacterium]
MSEVGHARNIQSFRSLVSFVTGYGGYYKPSNKDIELTALNTALAAADAAMDLVTAKLGVSKTTINTRQNVYAPLRTTVARSVNYYASTGAAENSIEDAKGFKRKIDGKRASAKPVDDPSTPEDESAGSHSAAQTSYTQRAEHLDNLIAIYQGDPFYMPNETDLTTTALQTLSNDMKAATQAVIDSYTDISNARLTRSDVMYAGPQCLFSLQKKVKAYVKGLYGPSSDEYKQISRLKFVGYED